MDKPMTREKALLISLIFIGIPLPNIVIAENIYFAVITGLPIALLMLLVIASSILIFTYILINRKTLEKAALKRFIRTLIVSIVFVLSVVPIIKLISLVS